jgi:hypothetical protein
MCAFRRNIPNMFENDGHGEFVVDVIFAGFTTLSSQAVFDYIVLLSMFVF